MTTDLKNRSLAHQQYLYNRVIIKDPSTDCCTLLWILMSLSESFWGMMASLVIYFKFTAEWVSEWILKITHFGEVMNLRNLMTYFVGPATPACSLVDQCGVLYSALTFPQVDRSGKLGYEEFKKLWNDLRLWKVRRFSLKYFYSVRQLAWDNNVRHSMHKSTDVNYEHVIWVVEITFCLGLFVCLLVFCRHIT